MSRDSDGELSSSAVVESIRAAPTPVVNTRYLADEHDVPVDDLVEQLTGMVEDGRLKHHEVEGRWHLWWLPLEADRED